MTMTGGRRPSSEPPLRRRPLIPNKKTEMRRVPTAGDGNCFYHSLLTTLWMQDEWPHAPERAKPVAFSQTDVNAIKRRLRDSLAQESPEQRALLEGKEEAGSETLQERLRDDSDGWAEEPEIILSSRVFHRPICILSRFGSRDSWLCYGAGQHATQSDRPPTDPRALLFFHTGDHYDALINDAPAAAPSARDSRSGSERRAPPYASAQRNPRSARDSTGSEIHRRHAAIGVGAVGLALGLAMLLRRRAP